MNVDNARAHGAKGMTDTDMREAAEAMEDLLKHPGWALLEALSRRRLDGSIATVSGPVPRPYETHLHEQGVRYGVEELLGAPARLVDRWQRRRDELNAQAGPAPQGG